MRTVSVKLLADIRGYTSPMREAKTETKALGGEIDKIAKGKKFEEIGRDAESFDLKIRSAETSMRALATAFAKTGDPKILAAWKEQGRVLSDLKAVKKFLPEPAEALKFGQRLGEGVSKAMPPQIYQAIIAGGIAGSPFLAATLVGAVTGGAGALGIGGGIALALRDPAIKAEAKNLGGFIDSQMRDSFGAFGPATIQALQVVRRKVIDLREEFDRIGDNSANALVPLTESVTEAVEDIIEGLDRVIETSGPTMAVIGDGIEMIGEQAERFLNMVASNSDVGAKALADFFAIIEFGLQSLTVTVDLLALAYKYTMSWTLLIPGMSSVSKDLAGANKDAGVGTGILGAAVEDTGKKVEVATRKFVALEDIIAKTAERNMSAAEASIALRASYTAATEAVDKKRQVTDKEMTSLIGLAKATNNATEKLDAQGRTVGQATAAHETNRKKLIEVAMRMGATRTEAIRLANQYLATPKNVGTNINQPGMKQSRGEVKAYHKQLDNLTRSIKTSVTVTGDKAAYAKLKTLLIAQQAASKGINISAATAAFNKNAYDRGGYTGNGGKYEPAGIVHGKEFVLKSEATQRIRSRHPGMLEEMNATGQVPGYYRGGLVMPFPVNARGTKIMSMADALAKVAPAFGDWPGSPSAQRGDSGVWRKVLQLIKSGPDSGSFGNAYRPGDPKWHGSGRAVDWMGFNQDALASYLASKRPLELIHRTNRRDYAYTRGQNKGSFSSGLMQAHRNHIHIAMANGGTIMEPVFGVGKSGATYSFGEGGRPERVTPGTGGGSGAMITYQINVAPSPLAHPREIGRQIVGAIQAYEQGSGSSWRP